MIQITKTNPAPLVRNRGGQNKMQLETDALKANYLNSPGDYQSGHAVFQYESKIYAHSKIKRALLKCQNGKCAFCEANVYSIAFGDVEHFRPKGGFKQRSSDTSLVRPGYYWLAYEWDNLLFSCESCNRKNKGNLFPIRNCERRSRDHSCDIRKEKPFLINPYRENPKHLIGFRQEVAYGKDRNQRGKKTIIALGLNRDDDGFDLKEMRKDLFNRTKATYKLSKMSPIPGIIDQAEIDEAKKLMDIFRHKTSQFSSMIQDNFPA